MSSEKSLDPVISSLEPLYSLEVAAELIPMTSIQTLYVFLGKHKDKFPARYRNGGAVPVNGRMMARQQRLLSESEIIRIREMVIFGRDKSNYANRGRDLGSPIARIMRLASTSD